MGAIDIGKQHAMLLRQPTGNGHAHCTRPNHHCQRQVRAFAAAYTVHDYREPKRDTIGGRSKIVRMPGLASTT